MFDGFDVESEGGTDFGDVLALQLFDDGGFAGVVESQDEDPHVLLALLHLPDHLEQTHQKSILLNISFKIRYLINTIYKHTHEGVLPQELDPHAARHSILRRQPPLL